MKENVIRYLENHLDKFTGSEKIIAEFFIKKRDLENIKITDVSKNLYISTATVSRFVNKIGYKNYKEFIYEFENALEDLANMAENDKYIVDSLWKSQKDIYEDIYNSIGSIDLKFIANKLINCEEAYFYCFGDMHRLMDVFIDRIRPIIPESHNIRHYERLMDNLMPSLDYHSILVVFYENKLYESLLEKIIALSKEKFVPIIIITISSDIDTQNYAHLFKLYPDCSDDFTYHLISFFTPYLVFTEALYNAIKIRRERKQKIYSGYF